MDRLIDAADQVGRHQREREATIELEHRRPPVQLQVEAGLPRTDARVACGERIDLRAQAAARRVAGRLEQCPHAGRELRIGGRGRVVDEGAVVARTVAVDVRADQRCERRARGQSADRRDLEARGQRMRDRRDHVVRAVEGAGGPFRQVRVAGRGGRRKPAAGATERETGLAARIGVGVAGVDDRAAAGETAERHRALPLLGAVARVHVEHGTEALVLPRKLRGHGAGGRDDRGSRHEHRAVAFGGERELRRRVQVQIGIPGLRFAARGAEVHIQAEATEESLRRAQRSTPGARVAVVAVEGGDVARGVELRGRSTGNALRGHTGGIGEVTRPVGHGHAGADTEDRLLTRGQPGGGLCTGEELRVGRIAEATHTAADGQCAIAERIAAVGVRRLRSGPGEADTRQERCIAGDDVGPAPERGIDGEVACRCTRERGRLDATAKHQLQAIARTPGISDVDARIHRAARPFR